MLSNIVPSKLVGCIKLDVAGNTDVVLDPPVLVKLNQFREIQWWGTYCKYCDAENFWYAAA